MPSLDLPELARLITSVMPGDQIPWSGIATIPWHLHQTTVTQRIATYVIIAASIMGIGGQAVIYFVDKATAHQCNTHDWPKEHDTLHRNWCITNGYDI